MPAVPLTCPRCEGQIEIDDSRAGKQIVCPACRGFISVPPRDLSASAAVAPPPIAVPPMAAPPIVPLCGEAAVEPPPVELTALTCAACGGLFQVATTLAGSRVACPSCHQLVMAPPRVALEPTPPPLPSSPQAPAPVPLRAAQPPPVEISPKQRAQRRHTRNVILWVVCLAILIAVVWLLR